MGVISDGNPYGIQSGIIFSFPVTVDPATKEWKIVPGLQWDDFAKGKIEATEKELLEEKGEAQGATANA